MGWGGCWFIHVHYPDFGRFVLGHIEAAFANKHLFCSIFKIYELDTLLHGSKLKSSFFSYHVAKFW